MQRTPPELTERARAMRSQPTDAERLLWSRLRTLRPRFTRQLVADAYILDFACRTLRLAVEVDGGRHGIEIERDERRTAYLESHGWAVLRFWNNEVSGNIEGVMDTILAAVARASTHPQPLPFREGGRLRHARSGATR